MNQQMVAVLQPAESLGKIKSLEEAVKGFLNMLEDFEIERSRFGDAQRASFNILEDFNAEKLRLKEMQRATLNILEDSNSDKSRLEDIQRASFNILEDFNAEKVKLEQIQSATVNILEDFDTEKVALKQMQKGTLNILEDFDTEKKKVETANLLLNNEISERRQAESRIKMLNEELEQHADQLEAANKELEAFSYSVSHDLRAPLRAIDGFSGILVEDCAGKLNDEGKSLLGKIRSSAQNMARLIDDLLAFSGLGRKEIERSQIDMKELARAVYTQLSSTLSDRAPRFSLESLPPAQGDPAMVRQVFVNLLSNASKYSRTTEGAAVEVGSYTQNGENVYYVKDNGVGFDMNYANKLFGVFQRLHGPEEFEGTGVGLAIVQRIIHRHGGRVWADGKVNEGATFYFTLPGKDDSNGKLTKHE